MQINSWRGVAYVLLMFGASHSGLIQAEPAQIIEKSLSSITQPPPSNYSAPIEKNDSRAKSQNLKHIGTALVTPEARASGILLGGPAPDQIRRESVLQASPSQDSSTSLRVLAQDQIVSAKSSERTFYWLHGNPRVLVLDMPNVEDQSRVFARFVIFIERSSAPRHRILSVEDVLKWRLDNKETLATLTIGNNIRGNDFAQFFNTARMQGEPITEDEKWILDRLIEHDVITAVGDGYENVAPEKIVISVPQVSKIEGCTACTITPLKRDLILRHELAHARFVTDQVYRHYVWWFWHNILTPQQRTDISKYLRTLGYDLGAPDMLVNEMQAFLIHTPESEYFASRAAGFTQKQLAALHDAFQKHYPSDLKPLRTLQGYRLQ